MLTRHKLTRFRQLTPQQRSTFLRAAVLLALLWPCLRLWGFRRVHAWLDSGHGESKENLMPADESAQMAQATAHMVDLAARHGFYRANCLPSSLALQHLLQRQGVASVLRVGVRKVNNQLEAHAWVEHDGTPLIDGPDVHERFAAFGSAIRSGQEAPQ